MPSDLIVPVVEVENVRKHPNADTLDICDVLGFQMVIRTGAWKNGDKGIYFPPDVLLPDNIINALDVRNYLRGTDKNRVSMTRLRGEPSFGILAPMSLLDYVDGDAPVEVGENVAERLGCKKYEPPVRASGGANAAPRRPFDALLEEYTDIQNFRLFLKNNVFEEGEEVVATEKCHGSNVCLSVVKTPDMEAPEKTAASHKVRRSRPVDDATGEMISLDDPRLAAHAYWFPWSLESVRNLMQHLESEYGSADTVSACLYGEVYGGSVQTLDYGVPKGKGYGFAAFDIKINGKYLDNDDFRCLCEEFGVPMVPVLYRGPFSEAKIKEIAQGDTVLGGGRHIREGSVIRPVKERNHPKLGRVVLKVISDAYYLSKHKESEVGDE